MKPYLPQTQKYVIARGIPIQKRFIFPVSQRYDNKMVNGERLRAIQTNTYNFVKAVNKSPYSGNKLAINVQNHNKPIPSPNTPNDEH
jgi:hypothetical protein